MDFGDNVEQSQRKTHLVLAWIQISLLITIKKVWDKALAELFKCPSSLMINPGDALFVEVSVFVFHFQYSWNYLSLLGAVKFFEWVECRLNKM